MMKEGICKGELQRKKRGRSVETEHPVKSVLSHIYTGLHTIVDSVPKVLEKENQLLTTETRAAERAQKWRARNLTFRCGNNIRQ
jgi:hypothetical protein